MYSLPPLPYSADALRSVIGEETMRTHHGKHHARYVRTVNELLGDRAGARPLEEVIAEAHGSGNSKLFNNAAQAWNHAFFWESMTPVAEEPAAPLDAAIEASFGGLSKLRDSFVAVGAAQFGSGWVWLMATKGKLVVVSSHDAEQPWLVSGGTPLLVCDVWEHAYYLDYKNEREAFLRDWLDRLANWDFAAEQLAAAARGERGYVYPSAPAASSTAAATGPREGRMT
jgi:Fe-Mn family superoxide dismutase